MFWELVSYARGFMVHWDNRGFKSVSFSIIYSDKLDRTLTAGFYHNNTVMLATLTLNVQGVILL